MKIVKFILPSLIWACTTFAQAQDVDEIINNYFENTGGYEKWGNIKNMKTTSKLTSESGAIPLETITMGDGRSWFRLEISGQFITGGFDGKVLWKQDFSAQRFKRKMQKKQQIVS